MSKRLKHYNEIQIMRNGMEQVKDTNGSVSVFPKEVTAGEQNTFYITYTVGKDTLHIGGILRFTIPFGFTKPQIEMPIMPGYCTAAVTRENAAVQTMIVENDWWKRGADRTKLENVSEHVGTHLWVKISGHALTEGDQVILTYGDNSYTRQAKASVCKTAGPVQFDVATDAQGQLEAGYSGFYLTSDPPTVMVQPKKAVAFEVIAPSDAVAGQPFELTVFAVDEFHNLAIAHTGKLTCRRVEDSKKAGNEAVWPSGTTGPSSAAGPECGLICTTTFHPDDCGVKKLTVCLKQPHLYYISAVNDDETLRGISNPIVCHAQEPEIKHFWGDMHGHTGIQWGRGSARSYYEFAKEVAGVDFCSLTDPDAGRYTNNNETARHSLSCYMSDIQWKEIQEINKEFYHAGSFVPLLGYEYHNDAPNPEFGGDRNVYYESYDEPIRRCVDEGSYCPAQLWQQLKDKKVRALTIPHHTAKKVMPGSWEIHDEDIQRLVEIYSCWGSSEGEGCERPIIGGSLYDTHSVQYALNKGYRLGFVTGSDTHAGMPGYSHWVFSEGYESYRGGLTCAMTTELNKESIFRALYNRNVYATTGERILLEFTLNGVPMGQELPLTGNETRTLSVKVTGTDEIDVVDIISMGHTVYTKKGGEKTIQFTFTDDRYLKNGWIYYYVRVIQKNKGMAWSSPVWVG